MGWCRRQGCCMAPVCQGSGQGHVLLLWLQLGRHCRNRGGHLPLPGCHELGEQGRLHRHGSEHRRHDRQQHGRAQHSLHPWSWCQAGSLACSLCSCGCCHCSHLSAWAAPWPWVSASSSVPASPPTSCHPPPPWVLACTASLSMVALSCSAPSCCTTPRK